MKPLILVGMNARTRSKVPWESNAEIWTLNEAYIQPWLKRYDVLFQLHPRWDWERRNNIADPNHPLYLKGESGPCIFCSGTGKINVDSVEQKCKWCKDGQYELPAHRAGKTIIMQDMNHDVPGCARLPIEKMTDNFCEDGKPYFTSTFAHMLVFALWVGFKDIKIYGFEMESDTEYANQKACAEYWMGYGRAPGIKIEAPGSGLCKGDHYAYQTNAQGYRQRLEIRVHHLKMQLQNAEAEAIRSEGGLNAVTPFKGIPEVTPAFDLHFDEHFKRKGFVSFLRGTIRELENAIKLYDAYMLEGKPPEEGEAAQMLALTYELG